MEQFRRENKVPITSGHSSSLKSLVNQLESNVTSTYRLIQQASRQIQELSQDITTTVAFFEDIFLLNESVSSCSENDTWDDEAAEQESQSFTDCRLREGDNVVWLVGEERVELGTVRWIGIMHDGMVAGVEFDDPVGNTDGEWEWLDGKKIFTCKHGHGRFVLVRELILYKDYFVE